MSSDNKYLGVYRGIIADANDPLNLGRAKIYVPQILGESVTDWAWPVTGAISEIKYPYGTFYTTADQTINTTTTLITGWAESTSNKITLTNNRFYIKEEGDYLVNLSAVVKKDTLGFSNVSLWLRKNGVNVPNSGTSLTALGLHSAHTVTAYTHVAPSGGGTVTGNHTDMVINHSGTSPNQGAKHSFILRLLVDDYLEFACSADATGAYLNHSAAGTGPVAPGLLATISLIGKYKPQPKTGAWVMFEGGDPNFPLWVGVF